MALVELALVVPALAFLTIGVVDLGRAFSTWSRVREAARQGALYAQGHAYAVSPSGGACPDPANITWAATREGGSASAYAVTVTPAPPSGGTCDTASVVPSGTVVTVRVATTFRPITPFVTAITGSTVTLSSTVKVRTP